MTQVDCWERELAPQHVHQIARFLVHSLLQERYEDISLHSITTSVAGLNKSATENTSPRRQQFKENFKKARFCCESYFVYTVMFTLQLIRPLTIFLGRGEKDPESEGGKVDQSEA
ncbi:uncharacterized protein TNCV_1502581 [Trichonephila clavipes]|uniref:Uncharacterized protein n=1 Tax=Trichonephila clavipes TaxID=2585209 RepID=A0A8X6RQY9_TRICX|nr:uncharacterized protein TNCV_1502581 [Trichonephila clavipes]